MANVSNKLPKMLYILQDESNPYSSGVDGILPETILDQVYDNMSPTNKTLREIIADLRQEIITGGSGSISFPVTTVNGKRGDVVLVKSDIGLSEVDNTADMAKPLSDSQRASVKIMIDNAVAEIETPETTDGHKINWDDLYYHLRNRNNPHVVTFEQINSGDDVTNFVENHIGTHNTDPDAHLALRNSIEDVARDVEGLEDHVDARIDQAINLFNDHYVDPAAHSDIFDTKENLSDKANTFLVINHTKYPTTRAVAEFIAEKLEEFKEEYANVENWIEDVHVVDSRTELPAASDNTFQQVYFIRHAEGNTTEIAVCRKLGESSYYWDYSRFTSHAEFDPEYFYEGEHGLTINPATIAELILEDESLITHITSIVDDIVAHSLENYVTQEEFHSLDNVTSITITQGTIHGSIRYYINNDVSTMSDDVSVPGLKRMAYMDSVNQEIIPDNTIQTRHIMNNNITTAKINDKAVTTDKLTATYMTVLGNSLDPLNRTANEITMDDLKEILSIEAMEVEIDKVLIRLTDEQITTAISEAYDDIIGE